MSARDTSIDAYHAHDKQPQLDRIMAYIVQHPYCTRRQVSAATGIEVSSVAGRVDELRKLDKVRDDEKIICPITRKKVHALVAVPRQPGLF